MPSGWLTAELCTGPLCLTKVTSAMVKLTKRKRGQLLVFIMFVQYPCHAPACCLRSCIFLWNLPVKNGV